MDIESWRDADAPLFQHCGFSLRLSVLLFTSSRLVNLTVMSVYGSSFSVTDDVNVLSVCHVNLCTR